VPGSAHWNIAPSRAKRCENPWYCSRTTATSCPCAGGWTLTWQGTGNSNEDFPGATSIYGGIRAAVTAAGGSSILSADGSYRTRPDVAIVVFGEDPYAEWHGDLRSIKYRAADTRNEIDVTRPWPEAPPSGAWFAPRVTAAAPAAPDPDLTLLARFRQMHIPTVAVFLTGRPRGITPELDASGAFVVAWLPGSEGAGIADVLFRKRTGDANFDFAGKLPFPWPRQDGDAGSHDDDSEGPPLFPLGYGLTYCNRHCEAPFSAKLWQTRRSSMSQSTPGSR
jgi:beta-glucosidase